jgi:hypothetical protein
MEEDVVVMSAGPMPLDAEQCRSLYCGQDVAGQRAFSSHLYCAEDWQAVALQTKPVGWGDPLSDMAVVRFPLPEHVGGAIGSEIFGAPESVEAQTDNLSERLADEVSASVSEALGLADGLRIRRRVKPIASLPAKEIVAGRTTDGLHLDARQAGSIFRVGINLGSASRYVICALSSLGELASILGTTAPPTSVTHAAAYDYARLASLGLRVIRFEVQPGYGWMMKTENILHDGRRAHPQLPSRFVLTEAEAAP